MVGKRAIKICDKWENPFYKNPSMQSLTGVITALATPFKDGRVDESSFKKLLALQMEQGVDGFVVNGTTGESPCLSMAEVEQLFTWTKKEARDLPRILGVGGNNTAQTLENIKRAEQWGAHAVLTVAPYYNKPPQRGMIKHFTALAEGSALPVILYNVPARTVVGLSVESVLELSHHPRIMGIKEATGDLSFGQEIIQKTAPGFLVLSGDDETAMALCARGGAGVVSVVSHIIGRQIKSLFKRLANAGENKEDILREYKEKYAELLQCLYAESNPIGIKSALNLMGVFESAELRSPLCALAEPHLLRLKQAMQKAGLL